MMTPRWGFVGPRIYHERIYHGRIYHERMDQPPNINGPMSKTLFRWMDQWDLQVVFCDLGEG